MMAPSRRVTRARASRAEAEARVREVADLMRAGAFVRGRTARELAARWGVSRSVAEHAAAEASRMVARELEADRDMATVAIWTRLERVMVEGEDRDAVKACELAAKLLGLMVERHEVAPAVRVVMSAEWAALRIVLRDALEPFPEASAAVVAALEAYAKEHEP